MDLKKQLLKLIQDNLELMEENKGLAKKNKVIEKMNKELIEDNEELRSKLTSDLIELKSKYEKLLEEAKKDAEETEQIDEDLPYTVILINPIKKKCILDLQNFNIGKHNELTFKINGEDVACLKLSN